MDEIEIHGRKYTQVGSSRYRQIQMAQADIPVCGARYMLLGDCDEPGIFDAKTIDGPWADLCETHVEQVGVKNSNMGFHRIPSPPKTSNS